MKIDEKLGLFYLGKRFDAEKNQVVSTPLLYESKYLTTHAVCVGMTGSGKTGLGIALLEEAALDNIPAIIIDPKGDLTNLLLAFPSMNGEAFLPWVDEAEAQRKGMTLNELSNQVAEDWKKGLEEWSEGPERVAKYLHSCEKVIYTPASRAGRPISILNSLNVPSEEICNDPEALRERVLTISSSLLGLLGLKVDPLKSREHILISTILSQSWLGGHHLDLPTLIQQVQKPSFDQVGTLDLETFFPAKERKALAVTLNNLLASPSFQAWLEGDPLDIQQLLYTPQGKSKFTIITLSHLSDPERMFFVTLLLNEYISWMRLQNGTTSLRTILFMDEIFGFFPPTASPPSKIPMLTLLKQSRAYGIGIILTTQNPVDLDYKGLSNCGTWFIGKLQTQRDKARVLEGLKIASNGEMDSDTLDVILDAITKRVFLMRTIYEKDPILFHTRWTLSYLKGPLTLPEISRLTKELGQEFFVKTQVEKPSDGKSVVRPILPTGVKEYFLNRSTRGRRYSPFLFGKGKLHFVDAKADVNCWKSFQIMTPIGESGEVLWENGERLDQRSNLAQIPLEENCFSELPFEFLQEKNYQDFKKNFATYLYQSQSYTLYESKEYRLLSKEEETEADFRIRLSQVMREKRDEKVKQIKAKFAEKEKLLSEKIRKKEESLNDKQQRTFIQRLETWLSFAMTFFGVLVGRKITKGTISSTGTSLRKVGKLGKDTQQVKSAEEELKGYADQLDELKASLENEMENLKAEENPQSIELKVIKIYPRKMDISVDEIAILWVLSDT